MLLQRSKDRFHVSFERAYVIRPAWRASAFRIGRAVPAESSRPHSVGWHQHANPFERLVLEGFQFLILCIANGNKVNTECFLSDTLLRLSPVLRLVLSARLLSALASRPLSS